MSYTQTLYHIVLRTKRSEPVIAQENVSSLYKYIWGIIKNKPERRYIEWIKAFMDWKRHGTKWTLFYISFPFNLSGCRQGDYPICPQSLRFIGGYSHSVLRTMSALKYFLRIIFKTNLYFLKAPLVAVCYINVFPLFAYYRENKGRWLCVYLFATKGTCGNKGLSRQPFLPIISLPFVQKIRCYAGCFVWKIRWKAGFSTIKYYFLHKFDTYQLFYLFL